MQQIWGNRFYFWCLHCIDVDLYILPPLSISISIALLFFHLVQSVYGYLLHGLKKNHLKLERKFRFSSIYIFYTFFSHPLSPSLPLSILLASEIQINMYTLGKFYWWLILYTYVCNIFQLPSICIWNFSNWGDPIEAAATTTTKLLHRPIFVPDSRYQN